VTTNPACSRPPIIASVAGFMQPLTRFARSARAVARRLSWLFSPSGMIFWQSGHANAGSWPQPDQTARTGVARAALSEQADSGFGWYRR
jgi:hypothetical protein